MQGIRHSWRSIAKNKTYSLINVTGITVAITCGLIIFSYIGFHLSFNLFHENSERIYRVLSLDESTAAGNRSGMHSNALVPAIRNELPEVEAATRFFVAIGATLRYDEEVRSLDNLYFAEADFFEFFNFPLLSGVAGEVLREPNTVVISESYSRELFGEEDPFGKVLNIFNTRDFRIVGVMKDFPSNSHLQMDMVASANPDPAWSDTMQDYLNSWDTISMQSYLRLAEGSDRLLVEQKVSGIIQSNQPNQNLAAVLQPLQDVHLRSQDVLFEVNNNKGDIVTIYQFSAVAVLLLMAAVCNFVSLSTAMSMGRAREVGVRKTVGATRSQLFLKFMGETYALVAIASLLSLILGLAVINFSSPLFSLVVEESFLAVLFANPVWIVSAGLGLSAFAFLAGFYPALVLSSFSIVDVLRNNYSANATGSKLRKGLVVVQFTISIGLVISLFAANNQLGFLQNKSVGFDASNILRVGLSEAAQFDSLQTFRIELERLPEVTSYSNANLVPVVGGPGRSSFMAIEGPTSGSEILLNSSQVDHHFVSTLGMSIISGQNFQANSTDNIENPILINRAAQELYQWQDNAVGKQLRLNGGTLYTIIGVIEDFHIGNMRFAIEPLVLSQAEASSFGNVIKIGEGQFSAAVAKIQAVWERIYPDYPFEYSVYSQDIDGLLREEESFASQLFQFAIIAVFIACLGLYGLASYTTNLRSKEVGVRKILGASEISLTGLVLREYAYLIAMSVLIAWPLSYYAIVYWLSGFAYRIEISLGPFLQATLLVVLVGFFAVSSVIWRLISSNPVNVLRHE